MNKVIVEVGSTCTKIDVYDGKCVRRLDEVTIFFKKHYIEKQKISDSDFRKLVDIILSLKNNYHDIYVCGTSIFRDLESKERKRWQDKFKSATGYDFHIISQDEESRLTTIGATSKIHDKAFVFIGGGGSTEIVMYDKGVCDCVGTQFGVMDVMREFPDLAFDIAETPLDEVKNYISKHLHLPTDNADVLILAGGAHEKFARYSGINYHDNSLYKDDLAPIMMDIESRTIETKRYYEKISLDDIRSRASDPDWWYATRAMCAFVLVVAEAIGAKYIVPTNIGMVYGIIKNNGEKVF